MDTKEYLECISHMDPVEVLMKAEKPRKFAAEGNTEDAIACAMAEGFKMGWEVLGSLYLSPLTTLWMILLMKI